MVCMNVIYWLYLYICIYIYILLTNRSLQHAHLLVTIATVEEGLEVVGVDLQGLCIIRDRFFDFTYNSGRIRGIEGGV